MAVNDYCPINTEITSSPGLTTASTSAAGSTSDPIQITVSQKLDNTQPNALVENTNGLFVDICDTTACVDGLLNVESGTNHPVDGNQNLLIGMNYTDGTAVPFNAATGVYTTDRTVPFASGTWPHSCGLTSGQRVYAGSVTGQLYTEPRRHRIATLAGSNNNTQANTSLTVNQVLNELLTTVNNDDPCTRTTTGFVTFQWGGMQVRLDAGEAITIAHEYRIGGSWLAPTQSYFSNASGTSSVQLTLGTGSSYTTNISLGGNVTTSVGSRLRVNGTTGSPTLISINSVFTNSYYLNMETD